MWPWAWQLFFATVATGWMRGLCDPSGVTAVSKHPRCLLQRFTICPIFSAKDRWQLRMECMWGTDTTLITGCYLATLLIPRVKSPPAHCQCPTHKEKQTPGTTHLPERQGKAGSLCKTANWQSALTGTQSVLPFLTFIRQHACKECLPGVCEWHLCPRRVEVQESRVPLPLRAVHCRLGENKGLSSGCHLNERKVWLSRERWVTKTLTVHWGRPHNTSDLSKITPP